MNTPEIEELKKLIEEKYGKKLSTTTDFDEFSLFLQRKNDINVSSSTLKRLYGYVGDSHKPRVVTLNALASYLGHKDYASFVTWLKKSTRYNSSFFDANQLVSNDLTTGDVVEIGWAPNRLLRLVYNGNSIFRVIETQNTSLRWTTSSQLAVSYTDSRFTSPTLNATGNAHRPSWQVATAD